MLARLGQVLYWVACGVAALCAAWALFAFGIILTGGSADPMVTGLYAAKWAVGAIGVWLVGRAILYVLAAK